MENFDGFPWALVTVIGALVLAFALGYGMWVNTKRTQAEKRLTEAATKREYEVEDRQRPDRPHMPT
jgi:hypothetical protein